MLTASLSHAGVVSTGNEDEAKGSTQATDGEIPRRGGSGLRGRRKVGSWVY